MPDLRKRRIFLCGHPDMVASTRRKAYLAGASMKDIHADAFSIGTHTPEDPAT
jgi:ferredoxin-NADP reductase